MYALKEIKDLLFVPQYEKEKLHPNFINLYNEKLPYARDLIKEWANGFEDRDNKFAKEFQTTFNSSFWELYLFASLKELGLTVNMEYDRPDFVVEGENGFIIEATIASHAQNETPEWQKDHLEETFKEWPLEKIVDNATLRLANSFIAKSRMYKKSYNKLAHVKNKPYIIALAPFDSPYFFAQNHQAINRVLYGFDRYVAIDWDDENREVLDAIYLEEIEKETGSSVPLGYFTNSDYSHVSAVIFSSTATFGKVRVMSEDPRITLVNFRRYNENSTQPLEGVVEKSIYEEHLLDGLVVFHNPFADIPFEVEEFFHPVIAHSIMDVETKEFISDIPNGYLFQRSIQVIDFQNATPEKLAQIRSEINNEGEARQTLYPKVHK